MAAKRIQPKSPEQASSGTSQRAAGVTKTSAKRTSAKRTSAKRTSAKRTSAKKI
jgi:hypothetical protein